MAKIANPNESGSIATAIPEPNIRPRFFRSYPYTSSFSHALPGSGSYMSVHRVHNQKSGGNPNRGWEYGIGDNGIKYYPTGGIQPRG